MNTTPLPEGARVVRIDKGKFGFRYPRPLAQGGGEHYRSPFKNAEESNQCMLEFHGMNEVHQCDPQYSSAARLLLLLGVERVLVSAQQSLDSLGAALEEAQSLAGSSN